MKKIILTSLAAVALLGLSACGKEEGKKTESSETKISASSSTAESTVESTAKSTESSDSEAPNTSESVGDWADAQEKLKEVTEAKKMSTLFEHNETITNKNDQVGLTINGYQYIKVEDVSRNLRTPFGDQVKEGGILLISATYENKSDKSVYAGPGFYMSVTGFSSSIGRNDSLLDGDLVSELVSVKNEIKPNESFSGYVALPIKPEAMEKIAATGMGELELSGIYSKPDSFSKADAVVEPRKETIALSGSGENSKKEAGAFYEDKITAENMGTKTMLDEKEVNKTEKFEEVSVTVDGYQVASFEPNEDQASRFSNFDSGVVVLTAKITVKNEGNEALNVDSTSATLTVGGSTKTMSENMLQVNSGAEKVEKGQEATKYVVFTMDKESYDKLYKDQDYVLDVNIYNTEFSRITKLGDLLFTLN
ncbi:hypothetical protein IGI37_003783 [Enterococcus sp. AZ194]|uniref:DUF4352 domain-containing protein n=1 Tax=Enterococcus sp. AZ194 TaxID=2774629 RepID=UPI003F20A76A